MTWVQSMSPKYSRGKSQQGEVAGKPRQASGERLQKVLAAAGVASRRECETLILEGRVEVDRQTVSVLGTRVDPQQQEIRVDGTVLAKPRHVYYLVNKPMGVVSTNRDPEGRARVVDLVPSDKRLFAIGRLDRYSEGLIILTNDGELTNQLTHPRYGIAKTYRAKVVGFPTAETLEQLRKGVHLAEGMAQVASLTVRGRYPRGSDLEIVLTEGRNREIRRILAKVGHKVQQLRRTAIGPIRLGQLQPGEYRLMTFDEVRQLRRAVQRLGSQDAGGESGGVPRGKLPVSRTRSVRAAQAPARAGKAPGKRGGRPAYGKGAARGVAADAKRKTPKKPQKPTQPTPHVAGDRPGTVLDYDQPAPVKSTTRAARPYKKTVGKGRTGASATRRPGAKAARKGKRR